MQNSLLLLYSSQFLVLLKEYNVVLLAYLNTDLPPNIAKESQNRKRVSQIRPNSMLSKTYSPKQTDCIFRNQNHQQNELIS